MDLLKTKDLGDNYKDLENSIKKLKISDEEICKNLNFDIIYDPRPGKCNKHYYYLKSLISVGIIFFLNNFCIIRSFKFVFCCHIR